MQRPAVSPGNLSGRNVDQELAARLEPNGRVWPHVIADQKKGASAPPPISAYEEVFARSVQTALRSEHWPEHPNAEHLLDER